MEAPKVHQTITILYGAFLASSFVYVMVSVFLQTTPWRPAMPQWTLPLFLVLLAAALGSAVFVLRQKSGVFSTGSGPVAGDYRQFLMSRCVLWFAVAEIPAILGFLLFILTGSLGGMLALVCISAVAFTLAKPSLSQLEELERRR